MKTLYFFAVEQRVTFTSRPLLSAIKKNALPASLLSKVVCNFSCHCNSQFVGSIYRRKFVNACQNLLEPAKFQTLATSPLGLANL